MKFKKIELKSFGKFNNETLDFEDGFNFIYGENEAGKSTMESAIYGLFYGFSKDSIKRRLYDDKFENYRPLLRGEYHANIEFTDEKDFRIERDFASENVKVLNLTDSEDISDDIEFNKYSRIKQPGAKFIGMSSSIFKSTFFVESDAIALVESLRTELRDLILEVSSTMDISRSTSVALKEMDSRIKSLGNESLKSSKLGALQVKVDRLLKEKLELDEKSEKYNSYLKDLEDLYKRNKSLDEELVLCNKKSEYETYKEVERLKKEIERIRELKNLDIHRYEKLLDLNDRLKRVFSEIDEVNLELKQKKVETLTSSVKRDYENLRKSLNRLQELNSRNYSREIANIAHDVENLKIKEKFLYLLFVILGVISIGIAVASFKFKIYYLLILLLPIAFYFHLRIVKFRVNHGLIRSLISRMDALRRLSQDKTIEKREMDTLFSALSSKYSVKTSELEDTLINLMRDESINDYKKSLRDKNYEDNLEKLNRLKELRDKLQSELDNNLRMEEVSNLDELREKFKNSATEESVNNRIRELNRAIEFHLNGKKFEDLNREVVSTDFDFETLRKEKREVELNISKNEINIQNLDLNLNRIQEIEGEIEDLRGSMEDLNFEREALELSKSTLLRVMLENKEDNLPKIIEKTSLYFREITEDKYEYVMIDDDLNLSVKSRDLGITIDEKNLSTGTIGQLYLSFRLALIEIISEEKIPLIMDDALLTFDDRRARTTMKLLRKISEDRQVLYFTSSTRDLKVADEMKINILRLEK
ncbi:ATP-binding protein [Peptoniphilus sp. BV3AC2]|uniref:ATP-binding protein n=1 Tax=Peptoniphilus sp. BV3AC2 TaxID=1111133 RepID=UPI0003B84EC6|nr:AAA family ATPase [Peptoniphilus sp. BV3AC2]ERT64867.1 AAA domain protein [Peptoniphilus sp. BV3AC2]